MKKVSVIMPSLNVVKYIKSCIDSVLRQTLKDIEIIVVDAGSTDGTLEIVESCKQEDERIHIIHSERKSYGYQMNLGISKAKGRYISIVETDDIIEEDALEVLYEKAIQTKADYVKGCAVGFFEYPRGGAYTYPIHSCNALWEQDGLEELMFIPKDSPQLFWDDNFLWTGIYNSILMKKIKFNETPGAAFQDIGALFQILSSAEKGVYIRKSVYRYRRTNMEASSCNPNSINFASVEYQYAKQFLKEKSFDWMKIYYCKIVGLILDRFDFMVASGRFWEESVEGLEALVKKVIYAVDNHILSMDYFSSEDTERLKILLEDPYKLYEHDLEQFTKRAFIYRDIYRKVKDGKAYIFGAGRLGKEIHSYLLLRNYEILAFVDNNGDAQGAIIDGTKVISAKEAVDDFPDAVFIIANKKSTMSIRRQLYELGVEEDSILEYTGPLYQLVFQATNQS